MPQSSDRDANVSRFHLLMDFLMNGTLPESLQGGKFEPWEMDILLDVESHDLRGVSRLSALRGYQQAVQDAWTRRIDLPFRFSDYLEKLKESGSDRKPAERVSGTAHHPRTRSR